MTHREPTGVACPCGRTHEVSAHVAALIRDLGPDQPVTVLGAGTWAVPRVWIAVHGLKANELPALAGLHGWPAGSSETAED